MNPARLDPRTRYRIGTRMRTAAGAVHVLVDGSDHAPVVVLLHGFGGSMHSDCYRPR